MSENPIEEAVRLLGGYSATGRVCGVTYKAVTKWCRRGRLPRTEATGETEYSTLLAAAHPGIDAERLRATVFARPAEVA